MGGGGGGGMIKIIVVLLERARPKWLDDWYLISQFETEDLKSFRIIKDYQELVGVMLSTSL